MASDRLMHIGELAAKLGLTTRALRYYEELGMIEPEERTEGSFRLYSERQLKKLEMIRLLKCLDFPLATIRDMMTIKRRTATGGQAAGQLLRALNAQLEQLNSRIAEYNEMVQAIEESTDLLQACVRCDRDLEEADCSRCSVIQNNGDLPLPMHVLV